MIFKNQTAVRLILRTGINFSETPPDGLSIKFRKPDGTLNNWDAAILIAGQTNGDIYVDFSDTIKFDQPGRWILWAYLVFPDGRIGIGQKQSYLIEDE
jgi:hypothetical protein